VSIRLGAILCLVLAAACATRVHAAGIGGKYSGRYQCGDWNALDLAITEEGAGKLSAEFIFPVKGGGTGSYSMTGQYDERTGTFLLVPQRWTRRPAGYQMVGMEGRYDPATKRLTGKIAYVACRAFELVGEGGVPLAALPSGSAVQPAQPVQPVRPPQVYNSAPNVQPTVQGVEYWDASMAADGSGKRVLREAEPIDDVIDWLKSQKYSCVGTQRIAWNADGTKATAEDRVGTRETYVIECDGDCRGLRYMPMTDASIYAYGRARPVPVLYMRNVARPTGAVLQWIFTREAGGTPPDIYVHHWNAHSFNSAGGCKAPKSNNK